MQSTGLAAQMDWVKLPGFFFHWQSYESYYPGRKGLRLMLTVNLGTADGPSYRYLVAVHERWRSGLEQELRDECAAWEGDSPPQPLVMLPKVTEPIGDKLYQAGVSYLDWEGSYELRVLDPQFQGEQRSDYRPLPLGCLAFVRGRHCLQVPPGLRPAATKPSIRLAGRSQQVAISLLLAESLHWETQLQLLQHMQAEGAALTPTQVGRGLSCLEDRGLLEWQGTRAFRLLSRRALYDAVLDAWPAPKLSRPLVYWQVPGDWVAGLERLGLDWRYSGGSMLRRQNLLVESGPWEIMAPEREAATALAALGGKAVDNRLKATVAVNGNVEDNDFYPRLLGGDASRFHILKDLTLGRSDGRQWQAAATLRDWLEVAP